MPESCCCLPCCCFHCWYCHCVTCPGASGCEGPGFPGLPAPFPPLGVPPLGLYLPGFPAPLVPPPLLASCSKLLPGKQFLQYRQNTVERLLHIQPGHPGVSQNRICSLPIPWDWFAIPEPGRTCSDVQQALVEVPAQNTRVIARKQCRIRDQSLHAPSCREQGGGSHDRSSAAACARWLGGDYTEAPPQCALPRLKTRLSQWQ